MTSIELACTPPEATIMTSEISCNGFNDGAIDTTVSGVGGYSYLWSNNDTIEDIYNLSAGIYNVIITDSLDCIFRYIIYCK